MPLTLAGQLERLIRSHTNAEGRKASWAKLISILGLSLLPSHFVLRDNTETVMKSRRFDARLRRSPNATLPASARSTTPFPARVPNDNYSTIPPN
jgi:hypothetical protein